MPIGRDEVENLKAFLSVSKYYAETLPLLLQELDDVYHDVSAVVAETMIQARSLI